MQKKGAASLTAVLALATGLAAAAQQ
ncbi:MAG: hypothetical protein ACI9CV_001495, partial [Ilumatobacter sp.]